MQKYQMNTIRQLKGDRTLIHEWILSNLVEDDQHASQPQSHKMQKNQGIEHDVFKGD
jgi:hypothetical protein